VKILAVIKQADDGCDYTIGCGTAVAIFDAESVADAERRVLSDEEYGSPRSHGPGGERRLASITLYPLAGCAQVDLAAHWRACAQREADAASADAEQRERAEFERLRAKYGSAK